jgi:hypothetical protein
MVLLQGSLVAMKGKARSSALGWALQPKESAWEAAERIGNGRAQARRWRWGNVVMGSTGATIYRGKWSCGCRTLSLSSSPTESKIRSGLLRIWFGFNYTTVLFLHSEVFTICGSMLGQHGHRVHVMGWPGGSTHAGGLGWLVGSGTRRVDEHRWWRCFSDARSHELGIWPMGRWWTSAAVCVREQGDGQAGPVIGFSPRGKRK